MDEHQKERAPELTHEVDQKLAEVDEKLDLIDTTLGEVRSDLVAWRKALKGFYAAEDARSRAADGKR